eukprot:260188-Hanusia_phi.AAC.4
MKSTKPAGAQDGAIASQSPPQPPPPASSHSYSLTLLALLLPPLIPCFLPELRSWQLDICAHPQPAKGSEEAEERISHRCLI